MDLCDDEEDEWYYDGGTCARGFLMTTQHEHFVVDAKCKTTAVIVPIREYKRLLEDLHDLAVVAERRDETPISFDEMKRRLS